MRDIDRVQAALAENDAASAKQILNRSRHRSRHMSPEQLSEAERLIKLGEQLIKDFHREASRAANAEQQRQLLAAQCTGCGKPGSQTSLAKKSWKRPLHRVPYSMAAPEVHQVRGTVQTVSIHATPTHMSPLWRQ